MDPTTITMDKDALDEMFKGVNEKLDQVQTIEARLEEISGKLVAKPVETPPEDKNPDDAELHKGALEGIADFKVWDIPLGQALIGGGISVFASELIDGFLAGRSTQIAGVVKLAAAGAAVKWGGRMGTTTSRALALLLAYDGLRSLIPLDEWMGNLAGRIVSRTGGGLAGKAGMGDVLNQASKVANDYYSRALGG
jgi:hypothetical protein